jgi:uncharacterized membrane protein YgaE (UPF0421/DUF939 family)
LPQARTIVKVSVAAGISWWLGSRAGQSRPAFAALGPVLVLRSSTTETVGGSFGRVVGVMAGVGIGLAALAVARPSALEVGIVVASALVVDYLIGRLPRLGLDTRNQSAVSALIMPLVATGVTNYALARMWETVTGAGVALLVELVDARLESTWTDLRPSLSGGAQGAGGS